MNVFLNLVKMEVLASTRSTHFRVCVHLGLRATTARLLTIIASTYVLVKTVLLARGKMAPTSACAQMVILAGIAKKV